MVRKGELWKNFKFFRKKGLTKGRGRGILSELSPRGRLAWRARKSFPRKSKKGLDKSRKL
jgi:hypothetical protein